MRIFQIELFKSDGLLLSLILCWSPVLASHNSHIFCDIPLWLWLAYSTLSARWWCYLGGRLIVTLYACSDTGIIALPGCCVSEKGVGL